MQIPEDVIEKIKEQNDIVDIISENVRLKKSGRNYTGLCPFHKEKTPSFNVIEDKQFFHCFGKKANGGFLLQKSCAFIFFCCPRYLTATCFFPQALEYPHL